MITYRHGDIFETTSEAIVNAVNCVGVMGRGIALQFKRRFPENFDFYAAACKRKEVMPGKMLVFDTGNILNPRYVVNFPTKRHWRENSRMEDIASGLKALSVVIVSSPWRFPRWDADWADWIGRWSGRRLQNPLECWKM